MSPLMIAAISVLVIVVVFVVVAVTTGKGMYKGLADLRRIEEEKECNS